MTGWLFRLIGDANHTQKKLLQVSSFVLRYSVEAISLRPGIVRASSQEHFLHLQQVYKRRRCPSRAIYGRPETCEKRREKAYVSKGLRRSMDITCAVRASVVSLCQLTHNGERPCSIPGDGAYIDILLSSFRIWLVGSLTTFATGAKCCTLAETFFLCVPVNPTESVLLKAIFAEIDDAQQCSRP